VDNYFAVFCFEKCVPLTISGKSNTGITPKAKKNFYFLFTLVSLFYPPGFFGLVNNSHSCALARQKSSI
jgi:hypothetical protein